jgi:hypothetical protein
MLLFIPTRDNMNSVKEGGTVYSSSVHIQGVRKRSVRFESVTSHSTCIFEKNYFSFLSPSFFLVLIIPISAKQTQLQKLFSVSAKFPFLGPRYIKQMTYNAIYINSCKISCARSRGLGMLLDFSFI